MSRRTGGVRRPPDDDGTMPLVDHLYELRRRMKIAIGALVVGMVVAFIFFHPIFNLLLHPYCSLPASKRGLVGAAPARNGQVVAAHCQVYAFNILDPFKTRMRVSFLAGAVGSAPIWLWQLWGFITPGLKRNERRWTQTFVTASVLLFACGAVLAFLVLSKGLGFLLRAAGGSVTPVLGVNTYLNYVQGLVFVFGVAFEFPLVLLCLNATGLISAKRLLGWWRPAVVILTAFTAVAVPSPDPFTMLALALPLVVLFFITVGLATIIDRRRGRRRAAQDAELAAELGISVETLTAPYARVD